MQTPWFLNLIFKQREREETRKFFMILEDFLSDLNAQSDYHGVYEGPLQGLTLCEELLIFFETNEDFSSTTSPSQFSVVFTLRGSDHESGERIWQSRLRSSRSEKNPPVGK